MDITNRQTSRDLLLVLAAFVMLYTATIFARTMRLPISLLSFPTVAPDTAKINPEPVHVMTQEALTEDAVKKVGPSVVTISGLSMQDTFNGDPLSVGSPQDPASATETIGSGFIISNR